MVLSSLLRSLQINRLLLVQFSPSVAHKSRELLKQVADRLHARTHDGLLYVGGNHADGLACGFDHGRVPARHCVAQLVAAQDRSPAPGS